MMKAPRPMLPIKTIESSGPASRAGLKAGDVIVRINGHEVGDAIDLQFHGADPELHVEVLRGEKSLMLILENEDMEPLGILPAPMKTGCCGNHCTFCFIDQNPKGMRKAIYVKDEDYRFSFMHGNYVTLTRVSQKELDRIVAQRLSPLYLSIHAVNPDVRRQMLGLKKDDHLIDKLTFLAGHDIEMHCQVVLCPGVNDGAVLRETIDTLVSFYPQVQSLAIVPVGLTRHRERLPSLQSVTQAHARAVISQVSPVQNTFLKRYDMPFVYLSDEFYLLAEQELPEADHYGDFWQIENGVGLTRAFLDDFEVDAAGFPGSVKPRRLVIVTGVLAAPVLSRFVVPVLQRIQGLSVSLLPVVNSFYGESVTVSGLLTGGDICSALQSVDGDFHAVLPANCLNYEGVFLDDLTVDALVSRLGRTVRVVSGFGEIVRGGEITT